MTALNSHFAALRLSRRRSSRFPHRNDTPFPLRSANQTALQTYAWPGNLTDLQSAADRLIAIARDGSLLKASKALGVSNSTLHYWFGQVGMSLPLVEAG
jgi:transcriptional regulator of acetoin/glycerol metabolism